MWRFSDSAGATEILFGGVTLSKSIIEVQFQTLYRCDGFRIYKPTNMAVSNSRVVRFRNSSGVMVSSFLSLYVPVNRYFFDFAALMNTDITVVVGVAAAATAAAFTALNNYFLENFEDNAWPKKNIAEPRDIYRGRIPLGLLGSKPAYSSL